MSGEPEYQNTQYNPYQQQPQYVQQQPQYVQQQPQYVQQQPVYVQQQYGQQPVYVQQQPVYVQQQPQTVYVQQQPQQMVVQQQTTTTGGVVNFQSTTVAGEPGEFQCGTSTYGLRMDFKSRPYRDVPFLVFWLVAMFIWFILLIVFASKSDNDNDDSSSRRLADDDGETTIGDDFVGKVIGCFIIICVVGILCGFLWLTLMFRWAKNILKFLIGMKLLFWFILSIICFIAGAALGEDGGGFVVLGVIFLLVFLFFCLYYWCVRRRLRLAAAMIRLGTRVVQTNKATITLQFLTTIGSFVWWILWVTVCSLYLVKYEYSGFVGFLMLLMGYWTLEVLANIAHVTTCGVTAVWWFNKDKMSNPTWQSYRYATSRGLGSICCGSFLVALIQTLRSMAKEGARRGGLAACIFYIILTFLEWLAHYFSMYAFVQVAIYGVTFWQAAKNTWDLLSSRGFDALINDDLSNMVLAAGAFVGGVVTFILGGFITLGMFDNYEQSLAIGIAVYMAIIGFYIGYYFTLEFMFAVHSAIKAIFVCWAEDPAALKETHPRCYDLMATAWAKVYGESNNGDYQSLKTDQDLD